MSHFQHNLKQNNLSNCVSVLRLAQTPATCWNALPMSESELNFPEPQTSIGMNPLTLAL